MIPHQRLSRIANSLLKSGGRRVPESVLERDYVIAWLLIGLARSKIREKIAFKGGTALRRCHFEHYRFSEDLDFTLLEELTFAELKQGLEEVYAKTYVASGIESGLLRADNQSHQNSYTFYLWYKGPLPDTKNPREIKVDVTVNEKIAFPIKELAVLKTYDEYDIPISTHHERIKVYALEEVAAEKSMALLDPARREARDLYDLWYLISNELVELKMLIPQIEEKLAFKGKKPLKDLEGLLSRKESALKLVWEKRLGTQMIDLPEFDRVFRAVMRAMRSANLNP